MVNIRIFKCSTCQKLRAFEIHEVYDDLNQAIAECNGCYRTAIKNLSEEVMTDKEIIRCSGCGAWIIHRQKCVICEYEKDGIVPHPLRMGGW